MDIAQLGLSVDSTAVARGSRELKKFADTSKTTESQVTRSTNQMSGSMKSFARSLVPIISATAVVAGLALMKGEALAFGTALSEVSTLLDDLSEMGDVEQAAKDLAKQFGGLPVDQVKSFYNIYSAGAKNAAEATATLTAANKLAIGGVTDINTAVDGLTSTLNAYNLSGEYAGAVSDRFFVAMRAGKTTIGEISGNIGQVASIASAAGVSLDELLASVSAITTGGVNTASAVTQVRQAIVSMLNPTTAASDMAAQLGIQFDSQALASKGLAGVLEEVKQATGGNLEQMAQLFGSVEALNAVLALTGPQGETFNKILGDMAKAAGATETAYSKMSADMKNQSDQLTAKMGVLRIEIGQKLIASALPAIRTLNENFETIMATIVLLTKLVGIYVVAVYGIPAAMAVASAATSAYTAVIALFSTGVTVATTRLGIMKASLGVVAAAFAGFQIGTYLRNQFQIVEKAGIALMSGLHQVAVRIGGLFQRLGVSIRYALTNPLDFARNKFVDYLQFVQRLGGRVLSALGFDGLAESLGGNLDRLRSSTGAAHKDLMAQMSANTKTALNTVKDGYGDMFAAVGQVAKVAKQTAVDIPATVTDVTDQLTTSTEELTNAVGKASPAVRDLANAKNQAAQAAQSLWEANERTVESLQFEADTLGFTTEAIQMRRLALNGATAAQMADADAALTRIKLYEQEAEAKDKILQEQSRLGGLLGKFDPIAGEQEQYAKDLQDLRSLNEIKLIEDQRYLEIKAQMEREHVENMMMLEEERFRQQSYGNELLMASLDQLEQSATNTITGLLSGATSTTEAFQNLGQAIFKEVVGGLVQMGIAQVKNFVMARAQQAISTAAGVAQGATLAAAYAPAAAAASVATVGAAPAIGFSSLAGVIPAMLALFSSFDGGGFTGYGSRSGGIDGKGGFPAIMHPNETVIDHTKGQTMGGGTTVIIQNAPAGTREERSQGADGREIVNVILGDIRSGGPISRGMGQTFGLSRKGT